MNLDEKGAVKDSEKLQALLQQASGSGVTDVIILAHGWNNSSTEAMTSYQQRAARVQEAANLKPSLRPDPYKPLILGLIWPSKAWDYGPPLEAPTTPKLAPKQLAALDESLPRSAAGSDAERAADFATLTRLAQKSRAETTAEDRQIAFALFRKYAVKPGEFRYPTHEDENYFASSAQQPAAPLPESAFPTIGDAARVFTFWQMKQRAGIVGENGGAEILDLVTAKLPSCRIHLFGHSFGCKLVLSAIKAFSRGHPGGKVNTVVLLQGAISFQAFADKVTGRNVPGGYKEDLKAIQGPVVATFSTHDFPLGDAYPLGARLAGQIGEVEAALPSRYSALGAVGVFKATEVPIKAPGQAYGFSNQGAVFSINCSPNIPGHSEISDPAVSWMDWAAMIRN